MAALDAGSCGHPQRAVADGDTMHGFEFPEAPEIEAAYRTAYDAAEGYRS
jgi:hypothetical protein